jgi:hypothetical protein
MENQPYQEEIRFVKALKDAELEKGDLAKKVRELPKNEWSGLKSLGLERKFQVTAEGLKRVLPTRFYETMGWDIPGEKKLKA